jgi:polyphosphate kinase
MSVMPEGDNRRTAAVAGRRRGAAVSRPALPSPINRELSQLAFNRRVLALARDPDVPLLERLRFLCIVSSNLDEFFEIRVAGLRNSCGRGYRRPG